MGGAAPTFLLVFYLQKFAHTIPSGILHLRPAGSPSRERDFGRNARSERLRATGLPGGFGAPSNDFFGFTPISTKNNLTSAF